MDLIAGHERTCAPDELLDLARRIAANFGLPEPRTAEEVDAITGFRYEGPDPSDE